ncbi:pyridoxamine 5'-phosphate oxidase family protein [Clostridium sp. DL1XJH146]
MFKEMRRIEKKLTEKESLKILENGEYGVLSMIDINGYAYGVPLSYTFLDNSIYFHCANSGSKLNNLKENNKVSFCVVGDTEILPNKFTTKYESVIAFGKTNIVLGDEKEKVLFSIIEKYSNNFLKEGTAYINRAISKTTLIKISIDHITGKSND